MGEFKKYSCPRNGYLLKDNYLSEFTLLFEKKLVRKNLGIDDVHTKWGNVRGNIEDLEDLIELIDKRAIPIASENTLGVIKVGEGLSIEEDGTLSANTKSYKEGEGIKIDEDDTISIHATDKFAFNLEKLDLSQSVKESLNKADTALQLHQDISGKQDKSNLVTDWSLNPSDEKYPSEKLVKDYVDSTKTEVDNKTIYETSGKIGVKYAVNGGLKVDPDYGLGIKAGTGFVVNINGIGVNADNKTITANSDNEISVKDGGISYDKCDDELKSKIDAEYVLPTASDTVKGGVKVGSGLLMNDETLSVRLADDGGLINYINSGLRIKISDGLVLEPTGLSTKVDNETIGTNDDKSLYIIDGGISYDKCDEDLKAKIDSGSPVEAGNGLKKIGNVLSIKCDLPLEVDSKGLYIKLNDFEAINYDINGLRVKTDDTTIAKDNSGNLTITAAYLNYIKQLEDRIAFLEAIINPPKLIITCDKTTIPASGGIVNITLSDNFEATEYVLTCTESSVQLTGSGTNWTATFGSTQRTIPLVVVFNGIAKKGSIEATASASVTQSAYIPPTSDIYGYYGNLTLEGITTQSTKQDVINAIKNLANQLTNYTILTNKSESDAINLDRGIGEYRTLLAPENYVGKQQSLNIYEGFRDMWGFELNGEESVILNGVKYYIYGEMSNIIASGNIKFFKQQ